MLERLTNLKSNVDKLDTDKLENVPINLGNLNSKVDKWDIDKLVPVSVDLSKPSDAVKVDIVKKDAYNAKIKNIGEKIPDITKLAINASLNAKINKVKGEIPNITSLATTNALTAVENKIHNISNLVIKTDYNTKINEIGKKTTDHDHDRCITTPEFNRLTAENFAGRH